MADPAAGAQRPPPQRPWWVKAFIVAGAVAALLAILSRTGVLPGGPRGHGPGRHLPGGGAPANETAPPKGHTPPPGFDHGP